MRGSISDEKVQWCMPQRPRDEGDRPAVGKISRRRRLVVVSAVCQDGGTRNADNKKDVDIPCFLPETWLRSSLCYAQDRAEALGIFFPKPQTFWR